MGSGLELVQLPLPVPALSAKNATVEHGCVLALPLLHGQYAALQDSTHFQVLKGSIDVWGTSFPADEITFHPILVTGVIPIIQAHYAPGTACKHCGAFCSDVPELCHVARRADTLVLLRRHPRSKGVPMPVLVDQKPEAALRVPSLWKTRLVDQFCTTNKTLMVAGGAGLGKSTLCLWLANAIQSSQKVVALMDVDPGQPMFGVPGTLSLYLVLAPCLMMHEESMGCREAPMLVKTIYYGHTSPSDGLAAYLDAVMDLYKVYVKLEAAQREVADVSEPSVRLIINTCGWVAGTGWQLLDAIGAITECRLMAMLVPSAEAVSAHRPLPGIRPTFQRHLLRHNVTSPLPWFYIESNEAKIVEIPAAESASSQSKNARALGRTRRVLTHLMEFPATIPDINDQAQISKQSLPPHHTVVSLDDVEFKVNTDSSEWKGAGLTRYNIELLFQHTLVAVECRGSFVSLAMVHSLNWTQNSVTLSLPNSVRVHGKLQLTLASKLMSKPQLTYCQSWAAGYFGPICDLPVAVPVTVVKKHRTKKRHKKSATKVLSSSRLKRRGREVKKKRVC